MGAEWLHSASGGPDERRNSDIAFKLKERSSIRRRSHADYRRAFRGRWRGCGTRSLYAAARRAWQLHFHDRYALREEKSMAAAESNRAPPTRADSRGGLRGMHADNGRVRAPDRAF